MDRDCECESCKGTPTGERRGGTRTQHAIAIATRTCMATLLASLNCCGDCVCVCVCVCVCSRSSMDNATHPQSASSSLSPLSSHAHASYPGPAGLGWWTRATVNQHPPAHHSTGCLLLLSCGWTSTELMLRFTLVTKSVGK